MFSWSFGFQVLHLVDFDQLKIENQQYMERIEERNNELLKLKLSTSRTVQVRVGLGDQAVVVRGAGWGIGRKLKLKLSTSRTVQVG